MRTRLSNHALLLLLALQPASCAESANIADDPGYLGDAGALPGSGGATQSEGGGASVMGNGGARSVGGSPAAGGASKGPGGSPGGAFASSGGAFTSSGGAFASSGGAFASSGGAFTSSGGAFASSGGAFTSSGGAFTSSGGAFTSSGGAFTSSGGASAGGQGPVGSAPGGGTGSPTGCMAGAFLAGLGRDHLLVGGSMSDATARSAPFDARYIYLAGGLFDGPAACTRCDTGCTAGGASCANTAGCSWWGCWQWDQVPPGAYARDFFDRAAADAQIPMITQYVLLQASGAGEGRSEVQAASGAALMGRYLADFRFLLDQIGSRQVLLHIEPDFWGYAEHVSSDPHAVPAAVASASPECAGFEDSVAGLGRCMIAMVRRHAPNARVGLHASGWGTQIDVLNNRSASLDVEGEARKVGAFMAECGAGEADFVVVDPSDRDAGWDQTQGQDTWWDETNATLPNFQQAFRWARALAERVGRPIVWWQVPVGHMSLSNVRQAYRDNRVDYLMTHLEEVRAAHGAAVLFGGGDGNQTTPDTDGGNLAARVQAYATQRLAPCP